MSPYEYLHRLREPMPPWLRDFKDGDHAPMAGFLSSSIVYYPGSGDDGQPVKLFGSAHSAHCFVYVDYVLDREHMARELSAEGHPFRGYSTLCRLTLQASDLAPQSWVQHVHLGASVPKHQHSVAPYGFLEILQRDGAHQETHGPDRLAILFLGADGIATYDALFCQGNGRKAPLATVVEDHSFGCNYDKFGNGGLLDQLAHRTAALPRFLLVAETTTAWEGYDRIAGVDGDRGGMHKTLRFLYERREANNPSEVR